MVLVVGDGGFDEEFLFPKRILQLSGRRNLQVKLLQIDVPPSRAAGEQMQLVCFAILPSGILIEEQLGMR